MSQSQSSKSITRALNVSVLSSILSFGLSFGAAMVSSSYAFAQAPAAVVYPASVASEFETLARDTEFSDFITHLDLQDGSYAFEYKTGGTSLGLKIHKGSEDGESMGKWLPRNEGTDVEAQVVSYHLGRFLKMGQIVVQSGYYTVRGSTLATFQSMLQSTTEHGKIRTMNQTALLATLDRDSSQMVGVLTPKLPAKNHEARGVADTDHNTINSSHPIAQFITAEGPVPSATRQMTLNGVKTKKGVSPHSSELKLAREFSEIMVLDLLCGQWDRFSGGNVEATWDVDTQELYFLARDNGGATMSAMNVVDTYLAIVSRFDRAQILRVQHLVDLLSGPQAGDMAKALQMKTNSKYLLQRAKRLLAQVNSLVSQFGEDAVYFAN